MTKRLVAVLTLWFLLCAGLSALAFTPGHLPTDRTSALASQESPDALADLAELAAEPDTPAENGLTAEFSDGPDALIRARQTARVPVPVAAWPRAHHGPLAVLPPDLPHRPSRAQA